MQTSVDPMTQNLHQYLAEIISYINFHSCTQGFLDASSVRPYVRYHNQPKLAIRPCGHPLRLPAKAYFLKGKCERMETRCLQVLGQQIYWSMRYNKKKRWSLDRTSNENHSCKASSSTKNEIKCSNFKSRFKIPSSLIIKLNIWVEKDACRVS